MSWMTWTMLLVWPILGLGVAYLFGRFAHEAEVLGNVRELSPPVVSYLRRVKRAKSQPRTNGHVKRRQISGGRRSH